MYRKKELMINKNKKNTSKARSNRKTGNLMSGTFSKYISFGLNYQENVINPFHSYAFFNIHTKYIKGTQYLCTDVSFLFPNNINLSLSPSLLDTLMNIYNVIINELCRTDKKVICFFAFTFILLFSSY